MKKATMEDKELLSGIAKILGHKGGKSKTEAKARAARENGKLGGRPPKDERKKRRPR